MKRLVVNAFHPGQHKVISSHVAKTPPPKRHRFGQPTVMSMLLNCAVARESTADLLASIGRARMEIKLCPCDLDQDTRSKDRVLKGHRIISGCSEAWYRAWFGTRRSWVQIPPARYPFSVERSPRRQSVGSKSTIAIE